MKVICTAVLLSFVVFNGVQCNSTEGQRIRNNKKKLYLKTISTEAKCLTICVGIVYHSQGMLCLVECRVNAIRVRNFVSVVVVDATKHNNL
uniref:Putative secreted protein n=1 Tax=Anopheles triannulatus TaxID=58253 RepID=A0A2M4B3J2_9DIPT